MSLLRSSASRFAAPLLRAPVAARALSTSQVVRDAQTPAAVTLSEQRDIVKEQQERQQTPVMADVVNDAPR